MNSTVSLSDVRLNFDPAAPARRFKDAGLEAAQLPMEALLPKSVQWPPGLAPTPQPLSPAPNESDDLTRFSGYDAAIMTWTAAEASALAALMSPGYPTSTWYEYRHGIANYIPLVTGANAPFRDNQPDMARYYQSLALYFPIQIGSARVLLMKCGLHMDYDGPATPLMRLIPKIVAAVQPTTFITTGTGGGIGSAIKLGDVPHRRFGEIDRTTQFKNEPWATQSIKASPIPAGALGLISPAMLQVNAARLPSGDGNPKVWSGAGCAIRLRPTFSASTTPPTILQTARLVPHLRYG